MADYEYGVGTNDCKLMCRHYPDRKNPLLVYEQGNECVVIGTIRNEDAWKEALITIFGEVKQNE